MVQQLASLRVRAEMDAGPYVAGMNQKIAADKAGAASSRDVGQAISQTDTKISQAGDGIARLSRQYVTGFGDAEKFERAIRTLARASDAGNVSTERADAILAGLHRRHGLLADATDLNARGHAQLAQQVTAFNASLAANDTALDVNSAAHARNVAAMRMGNQQRTNLLFQLQDVGVSLAGGMNPLLVMAQQGSQISMIYGPNEGGLGRALQETGKMALGAATKFWPLALAIGAVTAAVAGMQHEINETSAVTVSFGDTASAVWQVISGGIYQFIKPAVDQIGQWFAVAWDWVVQATRATGNFIAREILGAVQIIATAAGWIAPAFIVAGQAAANGFVAAIQWMVDQSVSGINVLIGGLNALSDKLGKPFELPEIVPPDLGEFDFGGAAAVEEIKKSWTDLGTTLDGIAERDYMGEFFGAVQQQAIQNATDRLAENEKATKGAGGAAEKAAKQAKEHAKGMSDQQKAAQDLASTIEQSLGSTLASLFDGPMDDADAFFDKLLTGFASIGQANLSKGFESLFGGGANDNQPDAMGAIKAAVSQGAEIGTEKGAFGGIFDGLDGLFGGKPGAGVQGAMGMASAGLGGLGIGYQTQDPLMGAIGGAMSGFAAGAAMGGMGGPIGAIVGGIAGLLGGMMGNNKALKEAKEALDKNRGAIENLIAKGMGTGIGQNQQAYNQFQDEAEKGISAAEKAKDWNTAYRLEQSVISFRSILEKDFLTSFDGMLEAMKSGLGANSPFAQAQSSVVALREELKSFAADAAFFGASADTARWAGQQYALSLLTGAKELTKFEDEVGKVEGTASALQLTLEQLNMSSDAAAKAINTGVLAAMHKLRAEFQDDLGRSLNDLSGAGYLNDIADAQIKYSERVRDAKALGLDSGGAFEELSLSLRNIVRDAGLTDAQLSELAKVFPQFADAFTGTLAGDAQSRVDRARSELQAAYDAEATAIQTVIDQLKRSIDSLGDFKASLRLDTNLSPLGGRDRLEEAQSQYQQVVAAAMGGDQEAIGKVEAVSRQYLDDARSYYASSENYFKIFEEVESTLDGVLSKASTQLSAADQQLAALKSQAGYLIDINVSVLSVADAITGLELAQAAQTKAIADTIASGAGGYSDQIKALYQNVLGRDPDPAGAGYWQGQINAGVGGDQLIRDFLSGAKAAGQIDMVPQALRDQYGFKAGGFTGYGPLDEIAGPAHRQEFVAHAQATRAYRPQLEAMNAGSYRPGNDNSSKEIVAALRSEIGELRNELRRIGSVIVQSDEATRGKIEKGNAELAAVSDGIKRVIAA